MENRMEDNDDDGSPPVSPPCMHMLTIAADHHLSQRTKQATPLRETSCIVKYPVTLTLIKGRVI